MDLRSIKMAHIFVCWSLVNGIRHFLLRDFALIERIHSHDFLNNDRIFPLYPQPAALALADGLAHHYV